MCFPGLVSTIVCCARCECLARHPTLRLLILLCQVKKHAVFVDEGAAFPVSWRPPDHPTECGCDKLQRPMETPDSASVMKRPSDLPVPAPAPPGKKSRSTVLAKSFSGDAHHFFQVV
jgi:hypothetical protein